MKQLLPTLLAGGMPLLLAVAMLARWIRRDLQRSPRQVKPGARHRQLRERRRELLALRRLAWPQRLTRSVRFALSEPGNGGGRKWAR